MTSNAEEAEVEWFYEDLQDLLELTPKKDVLFIIGRADREVITCQLALSPFDSPFISLVTSVSFLPLLFSV